MRANGLQRKTLELRTGADTDVHDLTAEARALVEESSVREGQLLVFTPGSTAGVTTIEFESGAVSDFARLFEQLAPASGNYRHNERWGDGNGYSHVRAALLGPSLTVPIAEGALLLGTWQQIVLVDFDNRPRNRKVVLDVTGWS
ncbi:MAG TPA: secondary thiamine-phosphate synthase enzyme YjbQ [Thermoanaerobaculia bacterium]|nr:secondary thiamine-phosphate synthase enzyme YjbQ [Thermoanaerobaculia bacterium]